MNNPAAAPIRRLCVSVAGPTVDSILALAIQAEPIADVIEIRLDSMSRPEITPLFKELSTPLLFTNRPTWEGGGYAGDEEKRLAQLIEAAEAGAAYIDIELNTDHDLQQELLKAAHEKGCQTIVSWHDFKTTASSQGLLQILQKQYRCGAKIGKIVTTARNYQDVLRVLALQTEAAEMGFPLIAFCMGRAGMVSRIATVDLGGYMTYAAPDNGTATAPGQLPATTVRNILTELASAD
ncbi:MAG: type I 3-dehydroquinate dehydratase [Desulfobulbaceae bacterium]|nr:type I 3-dehydroquinate dehydratase [Desulfobulbaceae bacterium]HIJ79447.1 type I 3-dehydroquinate dehydratase [Deltaproteobacteria bacterium]